MVVSSVRPEFHLGSILHVRSQFPTTSWLAVLFDIASEPTPSRRQRGSLVSAIPTLSRMTFHLVHEVSFGGGQALFNVRLGSFLEKMPVPSSIRYEWE